MESLIITLGCFNTDLTSPGNRALHARMINYYSDQMSAFNRDFNVIRIDADERIQGLINTTLKNLNIPLQERSRYLNAHLTMYELLDELNEHYKENNKISEFLAEVNYLTRRKWKKILLGGVFLLGAFELSLPFFFVSGLTLFQELLAAVLFIPVVGIVYTTGVGLYSLYKNFGDRGKKITLFQRFHDNFFLLADSALKFAAYSILIAAATTASPVAAILFVVAESAGVVKEMISLAHIVGRDFFHPP